MRQGLYFVHNALVGIGARRRIKLGVAGKIITGCIQSESCHTGRCPTGVATQDPTRQRALFVPDKIERVANFHRATLHELAEGELIAGSGNPRWRQPWDLANAHSFRAVA
jgi:glutamate synthase domain-containing protein 2